VPLKLTSASYADVSPRCARVQSRELPDGWRVAARLEKRHANVTEHLRSERSQSVKGLGQLNVHRARTNPCTVAVKFTSV
jgi:hypothetical protein